MKRSSCLVVTVALGAALALGACGRSNPNGEPLSASASSVQAGAPTTPPPASGATITQFSPAPGNYSSVPTSIQVSFGTVMDQNSTTNRLNWSLVCNAQTYNPNTVTLQGSLAVLSFSPITNIANGTACTLAASGNIMDTAGNKLSGTLTATYTIGAGGSSPNNPTTPTNPVYNPAFQPVVTVGPVGGRGGDPFLDYAPQGYTLKGLRIYHGGIVNHIRAVWGINVGVADYGNFLGWGHGKVSGAYNAASCPNMGNSRVVGIHGSSGTLIDRIGVICQPQDGSSQTLYYSPTYGGPGGGSFSLQCPAGKFVMGIFGRSGKALDQIGILCQ